MTATVYDLVVLPPILEIYVIWHPGDSEGEQIASWLLEHFHGAPYAGLVGGAVEVYSRSVPWQTGSDAPRPLPCQDPLPHGLPSARVTAVVPVIGVELARAMENPGSAWTGYLESVIEHASDDVGIFPVRLQGNADGQIASVLGPFQSLAPDSSSDQGVLCRELAQGIAQLVGDPFGDRLTVFISHTKRHSPDEEPDRVNELVELVRAELGSTHLSSYFDAADLQPGSAWDEELMANAASSALLVVRTDLYAGREWCQREFLLAKQAGMPIVTLSAVHRADDRGSFLMDHVPMVGYQDTDDESRKRSIMVALNVLVDGALRRAIWSLQEEQLLALGFDWLPLHAPEPATTIPWLITNRARATEDGRILVMHPDPPLGPDENTVLNQLFDLAGVDGAIDILTPRTYASRGGGTN